MGKNSLIKSTSKKKTRSKKTEEEKKTKVPQKAIGTKKAAGKAGRTPKAKAVRKPKADEKIKSAAKTKASPKKTRTPKKKPVTVKELLLKKFHPWKPDKLYRAPTVERRSKAYTAPPFISEQNEEEFKRVREILFRKYDFKDFPEQAPAKALRIEETAAGTTDITEPAEGIPSDEIDKEPMPGVSDRYLPPDGVDEYDPMEKFMKYLAAAFVILIVILVAASFSNKSKYYIRTTDGAVEILQGKFAPMGGELLISLPGAQAPERVKPVYSESEVLPLVFDYYIEKADALLEVSGMPDLNEIKSYVKKALSFAVTDSMRNAAHARLNSIDLMILLYKADVAASKPATSDLETALWYLETAAALDLDDAQEKLVKKKIESVEALMAALEKEAEAAVEAKPEEPPAK